MAPTAGAGAGGNIKVVVRVRPFNGREMDRHAKCIVEMRDNQTILTPPPDAHSGGTAKGNKDLAPKVFAFDRSYWSFDKKDPNYAGQDSLQKDLGTPLLDNAFQGYNNCIFAYGQTGSGKSYSMMGYGKETGIIPNICQEMFRRIEKLQADTNVKFTVEVSYLEIYNERVRDLLNPSTKGNLKVREHPSTGPYVEDLAKLVVSGFQEIEHLMDEGNKARTVAATNMNETSSRSHAVFTLMLTQKRFDAETKMEMEKVAKISLVDLAGSERATSTGATGARLKEGAEINRSLSTLGRVIAALADLSTGKKKKGGAAQVPYRDSVLTWLLKDSLGGNSMTAMIAAISPADINYDETLSTLRYADSAKRIKNHAVINEDANARMIRELKEELALLRSKMGGGAGAGSGGAGAIGPTDEVYAEGTPLEQQMVNITQADGTVKRVSKAEIAEQLDQSEKLLQDLNQTWEQKLVKTEEIHKEREAALEELGISIEKGFIGLSTPKKMPHLVNLSDDPLLAECLVYNLKPGTTTVGNVESNADHQANIRLNGSRILHEHCTFENAPDGTVTVVPKPDAAVMVNGKRITEPKQLHSGYRVILGDFHIFRFNHPQEARAERAEQRAEQSLLRQSVTASIDWSSPSPASRTLGHERSASKAGSELGFGDSSRPESPSPFQRNGRDSDWSFARREAASAILGIDRNVASLNDDELNALFEEVQKARAERTTGRDGDEDAESMSSYPIREKYLSMGTIDNFSLDTALTMPSTPRQGEVDDKMRGVREELQLQLEKQKEEYQDQLKTAEAANVEVEEIKKEKTRMEETLQTLKMEMQKQLEVQRQEFEKKIEKMDPLKRPKAKPKLSDDEIVLARRVAKHWRGRHYVKMAEQVLQHAAVLKEAQIMSQELSEGVYFQFAVIDVGHLVCSSYDMMLNGLTGEGEDIPLEEAPKPCIGVRVMDYKHSVVRFWSLEKLHERVRHMRQLHQCLDEPEYSRLINVENPFIEPCMPEYTLVGDADVPLKAVFESRVQDLSVDVVSPYTSQTIAIMKLSLEPSSARAPSNTLKFNVVMHEMLGFPEREGTDVHAQLFIPGVSEENGITTTQMIKDFDENPVRFESVHSMSIALFGPQDVTLRIAVFAKVTSTHLDKLLSWDDMRSAIPRTRDHEPAPARIAESQFFTEERHDVLARLQILEMNEEGAYTPVEVAQANEMDTGTFQLHQGIQRRIAINVSHSSGDTLPWDSVPSLRVGRIQLVDPTGKVQELLSTAAAGVGSALAQQSTDVALRLTSTPSFRNNANGTRSITFTGQWDSSLHSSMLLDRVTADKHRVQMTVWWEIGSSERLVEPMKFSMTVNCQIMSRSFVRQPSRLAALWQTVRFVHSSTAMFAVTMRPAPIKRVGDLWRMSSQHDYVKGEEKLVAWAPRGVSLVSDFINRRKKRLRMAEIGAAQNTLKRIGLPEPKEPWEVGEESANGWDRDGEESDSDAALRKQRNGELDSIEELLRDTPDASQVLEPFPNLPGTAATAEAATSGDAAGTEPGAETQTTSGEAKNSPDVTDVPEGATPESAPESAPEPATEPAPEPSPESAPEPASKPASEPGPDHPPEPPETTCPSTSAAASSADEKTLLLKKCLKLWTKYPDPLLQILRPENTDPPADGLTTDAAELPSLITTVVHVPKNPKVMKGGFLLVPSNDATRWVKRFVELRRPYLHVHNVTEGDEVAIVSLRNARVDSDPGILGLLESRHPAYQHNRFEDHDNVSELGAGDSDTESQLTASVSSPPRSVNGSGPGQTTPRKSGHGRTASGRWISAVWSGGGGVGSSPRSRPGLQRLSDRLQAGVFAVYGTNNTWLFAARSERDKLEWITRIDQSFLLPSSAASVSSLVNSRAASPSIGGGPTGR